jgi:hypothetical protein
VQTIREIDAPIETVWSILVDTTLWPQWGPSVVAVDCPETLIRSGLTGRVKTALGLWLPFEITSCQPPRYWHWKVCGVPATGHRLRRRSASRCDLAFEFPAVMFPYGLVCQKAANNIAQIAKSRINA